MARILLRARTQLEWSVFALASVHREWVNEWLTPAESYAGERHFILEASGFIERWQLRRMLREWWAIDDPNDARTTIMELLQPYSPSQNRAWDVSRALDRVIHTCLTCGYLGTHDVIDYWIAAVRLATWHYRGWQQYGEDVVRAAQEFHGPGWMSDRWNGVVPRLMSQPASPWWRVPWQSLGIDHSLR